MTARVSDILRAAAARLRDAGIDQPTRDARLLLAHAMAVAPDRLALDPQGEVPTDAAVRLESLVAARCARQPLAQITGQRLFWGRSFRVTRDVLDPRPETEVLVSAALAQPFARILDLGTGSGCILISLLADRPSATGLGVDVSPGALGVARRNAADHAVGDRAAFVLSDWFDAVTGRYDLIVSNPPYIAASEMPGLAPEVREWEPHLALTPGGDGLDAYRAIAAGAGARLMPGGRLFVEIGPAQGAAVTTLFRDAGLAGVEVLTDLDGRDRVVAAMAAT
ncbi:MAG: peptide chain release factor N(5)-glutamine methyltransferase [Paracoccaceae bacterium]|nr:MAG: peptide chain release factor N(5)-glutamine methyltransferase [Paracoccaceae bacterium]